jgi:hypothetical protein
VFPALLISMMVAGQTRPEPKADTIEITTYFATQLPPGPRAPVCVTGLTGTVGEVKSVYLVPGHEEKHDLWKTVIVIPKERASSIPSDSVVYLKLLPANDKCSATSEPFVEIDTTESAAALDQFERTGHECTPNSGCNPAPSGPPIRDQAVLRGEVYYSAEVGYLTPPAPWWRRLFQHGGYIALIIALALLVLGYRKVRPFGK